jgi:hypothetical protein
LRLVIGSWKIIEISLPRIRRISRSLFLTRSWPSKSICPPAMRPGGVAIRRITERLVTDLPEPDSPTTPSVSPLSRWKLTPSTALTVPSSVSK